MPEESAVQKTHKKFNFSALFSMISGILSYALLLFHSLIDMKMILALFLAPITAFIAIFTGAHAKHLIRKSEGLVGGKKMANTGLWLGWIYIIGIILLTVLAVVIFGGIVSGINSLLGSIGIG
ncbi:MAG: hypothetical protein CVU42_15355 [Chloroflexi bacterium HGW-Chloroflexi-4]|jgi:hypothetical protein|nr:MAG: hypothetical protein CVU42_15355 [Chloroflexi bacterium HGW-Chloroflexi-4]